METLLFIITASISTVILLMYLHILDISHYCSSQDINMENCVRLTQCGAGSMLIG